MKRLQDLRSWLAVKRPSKIEARKEALSQALIAGEESGEDHQTLSGGCLDLRQ